MNPLETTKRSVLCSTGQLRDCCLRSSYHFPQIPEHSSPTKYARVSSCSHGDVVMLFCPSSHTVRTFPSNWSAHHQTSSCSHDKLHSRVDEKRVRERVQVRCSDLVGSDLPHHPPHPSSPSLLPSMFGKLLHLSKSESFAMSRSRSHDLREAVGNLLIVTMYFQQFVVQVPSPRPA